MWGWWRQVISAPPENAATLAIHTQHRKERVGMVSIETMGRVASTH